MKRTYYAVGIALIALTAAGCAHDFGALDDDYGRSYRAAKAAQILNPEASKNLAPVTGLPGSAAMGAMKAYTDSFTPSQGQQQGPQTLLMTPIPSGAGRDAYGK